MSYRLKVAEQDVVGEGKYTDSAGNAECVEFVRQATGAPATATWVRGKPVAGASPGSIPRGTAIATFDGNGRYPTDKAGKHAAIYLFHSGQFVRVLDQWADQGQVRERSILFNRAAGTKRSNDGNTFYVIE